MYAPRPLACHGALRPHFRSRGTLAHTHTLSAVFTQMNTHACTRSKTPSDARECLQGISAGVASPARLCCRALSEASRNETIVGSSGSLARLARLRGFVV
eukprot:7535046-Pyramimonas_sp.AAC.1